MSKRFCDGCGAPVGDGVTFCGPSCIEIVRARLVSEHPRAVEELAAAPIETKANEAGGPLVSPAFAHQRPESFSDAPPCEPERPRYPLIFAKVIPAKNSTHVEVRAQYNFKGEAFRVDPGCAPFFRLQAPVVGAIPQIAGGSCALVPATLFDGWKRWDMSLIEQGCFIYVVVENLSDVPQEFSAVLFGRLILPENHRGAWYP